MGKVLATSLTNSRTLGLPFASWTLVLRTAYPNDEKDIPINHSRVGVILVARGFRWRTQES